jgi:hypothetical protein
MRDHILAWFGLVLVVAAVLAYCEGCGSASRAEARGAVLTTAEAVKVGDESCAKYALQWKDLPLAKICEKAYADARALLLTASATVDAWDEGKRGEVTCAVVHAANELSTTAEALRSRKADVPVIVDDALRLVNALGGCHD